LKRVSASRFFYKRFLLGEIYLGRTSLAYVLPETWRWFAQDMRESNPIAYLRIGELAPPIGNPFASYVARNFDHVFPSTSLPLALRSDAAQQVLVGTTSRDWTGRPPTVSHSGWKVRGASATYTEGPVASANDQLTLSSTSCFRLDGDISTDAARVPEHVVFRFDDNTGKSEQLNLKFEGATAVSSSNFVDFEREPTNLDADLQRVPFSLVVGRRSAALVIDGQVRAALLLPSSVTVKAQADTPSLGLSNLRVGSAPAGSGC
jgi:hypothetical protein